jgi:enoyl-CoA hydratase/carnithine racemase
MSYIKKEIRDDVCIMTFNRPEVHNAADDEAGEEAYEFMKWVRETNDFKVLLMRGEGRSFHTGRDTRKMGERKEGLSHFDFLAHATLKMRTMLDIDKPIVAAVKGGALGGGAEFAMVADFRVAATDLKFALPEVRFDAKTAYEWGLVDFVVPPEELDAKAFEIAARIAKNPNRAVRAAKALVNEMWVDTVRAAMRREYTNQIALYSSEDFIALREKRRSGVKVGGKH